MKKRSIMNRLIFFTISAGLLFGGLSNLINSSYLLSELNAEIHQKNKLVVTEIEEEFRNQLVGVSTQVNQLVLVTQERLSRPEKLDMDKEELYFQRLFTAYLNEDDRNSDSLYIYFSPDIDGNTHDVWMNIRDNRIVREDEIPLERYEKKINMDWFYGPKDYMHGKWIPPYRNRFDDHITSYVSPIYIEDNFLGIVGMYLSLDEVKDMLSIRSYYEGDFFMVSNAVEEIIYDRDTVEGTPVASIVTMLVDDQDGISRGVKNGIEYYIYHVRTENDWCFRYFIPVKVFDLELQVVFVRNIIVFVILLVIILAIMWIVVYRYKRVLVNIVKALEKMSTDNLNESIEVNSNDEIGALVNALNKSHHRLNDAILANEQLAYTNPITGYANRNRLMKDLMALLEDGQDHVAIFYIDVDDFRSINEYLGYMQGDEFIRLIGRQLMAYDKEGMKLYHTSVDEFVLLVTRIYNDEELLAIADAILSNYARNYACLDYEFFITLSIGVARIGEHKDVNNVFRSADVALYEAKKLGRNHCVLYAKQQYEAVISRNEHGRDFAEAVLNREFLLHYQPKIDIASMKVVSMEALVRWQHSKKGLIFPNAFIPYAEQNGLIAPLGEIVIDQACKQLKEWKGTKLDQQTMAINFSKVQLLDVDIVDKLLVMTKRYGIEPSEIEIEITESMFITDFDSLVDQLKNLKEVGFKISLDDFGIGYTSMNVIHKLPLDFLKIDKSLIDECTTSKETLVLLEAIIDMAKKLSLKVIAEGVESKEQVDVLTDLGCDLIQGYYFSKPVSGNEYEEFCEHYHAKTARKK